MGASIFNEMELDAIGEIMNISLGASATAVSTMLGNQKVQTLFFCFQLITSTAQNTVIAVGAKLLFDKVDSLS